MSKQSKSRKDKTEEAKSALENMLDEELSQEPGAGFKPDDFAGEELSDDSSSESEMSDPLAAFGVEAEDREDDSNATDKKKSGKKSQGGKGENSTEKQKRRKKKQKVDITKYVIKMRNSMRKGMTIMNYGPPYSKSDPGGNLGDECAEEIPSILQIHLLLMNRANPNIPDPDELYFTPMHWCGRYLHLLVMRMLRRAGAHIDPVNEFGQTPLSLVCMFHQPQGRMKLQFKCVRWLVEQGAQLNHVDKGGYSPIDFATMNGHVEIISYLLARGAHVLHLTHMLVVRKKHILSYATDEDTIQLVKSRVDVLERQMAEEKERREIEERHIAAIARIRMRHEEMAEFRVQKQEAKLKQRDDNNKRLLRNMHEKKVGREMREMADKPAYDAYKYGVWKKEEDTHTWKFMNESSLKSRTESIIPASRKLIGKLKDRYDYDKFNDRWKSMTGSELEVDWSKKSVFNVEERKSNKTEEKSEEPEETEEIDYRDENDDELVNEDIDELMNY